MLNLSLNISSRAAFSYNWNKGLDCEKSCFDRTKDSMIAFLKGLFCGYKVLVSDIIASGLLGGGHEDSIFVKEYRMKSKEPNMRLTDASASGKERSNRWERKYKSTSNVTSDSFMGKRISKIGVNSFEGKDVNLLLREAAEKGNMRLLNTLLDNSSAIGLDINAKEADSGVNKKGRTALHYAVMYGRDDILQRLLSVGGILINVLDSLNCTPLHYAAEKGYPTCLKLLLDQRHILILVNKQDISGSTPLIYAAERGCIECVDALLEYPNILINLADDSGWTAMHAACSEDKDITVERLLKEADILTSLTSKAKEQNKQYTPYNLAIMKGSEKCIKLLRKNGIWE